jgi:hypothetical protein
VVRVAGGGYVRRRMVLVGGPAMVEAVRTTASPAAIWAIVVVALVCLAFWLIAVSYADSHPYVRQRRLPNMPGPVLGGMHEAEGGRSVAPNRDAPAEREDLLADLAAAPPQPGHPGAAAAEAGQPGVTAETDRPPVPAQRGPQAPAEPVPGRGTGPGPRGEAPADAPTEPIPAQRGAPADTEAANRAGRGASGRS